MNAWQQRTAEALAAFVDVARSPRGEVRVTDDSPPRFEARDAATGKVLARAVISASGGLSLEPPEGAA